MIPKPLNEIKWSDLEALRDSGREEDDTIEYKASFSGGSDYLGFTDPQREKALKGIAREAIAFLNGRGGDILIGVEEESNDHPKIKGFNPLENLAATAERLAQALSATIEPYQSALGVRAIRMNGSDRGVIVVRSPSSLRAPHRFTRDRECYIRRGRESVIMPMDEIQDTAVQRNRNRSERTTELDALFDGLELGIVRRQKATGSRFHVRIAFLPFGASQIPLSDNLLYQLADSQPRVFDAQGKVNIEDSFRRVNRLWRPVLRGRAQTNLYEEPGDFLELVGRQIGHSGIVVCDVAWRHDHVIPGSSEVFNVVAISWVMDFVSCSLWFVRDLIKEFPSLVPGLLCARTFSDGPMKFGMDQRGYQLLPLLPGLTRIEPFEILSVDDLDSSFGQLQHDIYSLVEQVPPYVLSFSQPA